MEGRRYQRQSRSHARYTAPTLLRDVATPAGETDAATDIAFWTRLKARHIKLDIIQLTRRSPMRTARVPGGDSCRRQSYLRTVYIIEGQLWQKQKDQWRLAATKRSDPTRLQQPISTSKEIYAPGPTLTPRSRMHFS